MKTAPDHAKVYAGIGSRETPAEFLKLFRDVASHLGRLGWDLRSGHAPGADQAFEQGCDKVEGYKTIYIPWKGFEGSDSTYYFNYELHKQKPHELLQRCEDIAAAYHPAWDRLSDGAKKLHTRNVRQILGIYKPAQDSKFIICYTADGKGGGGTGQALRIARDRNIPIFDAGKYKTWQEAYEALKLFIAPFLK